MATDCSAQGRDLRQRRLQWRVINVRKGSDPNKRCGWIAAPTGESRAVEGSPGDSRSDRRLRVVGVDHASLDRPATRRIFSEAGHE